MWVLSSGRGLPQLPTSVWPKWHTSSPSLRGSAMIPPKTTADERLAQVAHELTLAARVRDDSSKDDSFLLTFKEMAFGFWSFPTVRPTQPPFLLLT
jgi:hypothetical protein